MKLMLCSGRQRREGWTTLDANRRANPDIVATLPGLLDHVEPGTCSQIELIHGIEHFYLWEARPLLSEIFQALEPGGLAVFEQPDISYAAKVLLGLLDKPKPVGQFAMWPLYGDPGHKSTLYCHRWGYTPDSLTEELVSAGFDAANISRPKARHHFPGRDFRLEARK